MSRDDLGDTGLNFSRNPTPFSGASSATPHHPYRGMTVTPESGEARERRRLLAFHSRLPKEWTTEREIDEILYRCGGIPRHDHAAITARRTTLVHAGLLWARIGHSGPEYHAAADAPPLVPMEIGTAAYNEALGRDAKQREQDLNREQSASLTAHQMQLRQWQDATRRIVRDELTVLLARIELLEEAFADAGLDPDDGAVDEPVVKTARRRLFRRTEEED